RWASHACLRHHQPRNGYRDDTRTQCLVWWRAAGGRHTSRMVDPREGTAALVSYARNAFPFVRADAIWRALLSFPRTLARDRALSDLGWIHSADVARALTFKLYHYPTFGRLTFPPRS